MAAADREGMRAGRGRSCSANWNRNCRPSAHGSRKPGGVFDPAALKRRDRRDREEDDPARFLAGQGEGGGSPGAAQGAEAPLRALGEAALRLRRPVGASGAWPWRKRTSPSRPTFAHPGRRSGEAVRRAEGARAPRRGERRLLGVPHHPLRGGRHRGVRLGEHAPTACTRAGRSGTATPSTSSTSSRRRAASRA